MDIVIDFDGTCVTHMYPAVGEEIGATPVLRELAARGHRLILSTMRADEKKNRGLLSDAVRWFGERGIPLAGVQVNPGQTRWTQSPKAYGDLYIDDRALGCPLIHPGPGVKPYVDWTKVRRMLVEQNILPA